MRRLLATCMAMMMVTITIAQENLNQEFYLLFEFMSVSDESGSDYLEVEEFWSAIHKQRVADQKIMGWDLWSLTPAGTKQGSQYLTVTLFATLEDMMQPVSMDEILNYTKKAHPKLSEKEMNTMIDKTTHSRDIARQVYLKQIAWTEGDFQMQVGTVSTIDIMKAHNDNYEKAESEIFKPWHQEMVDQGQKGNWGLLRTILPAGTDAYSSHITVNMYKDVAQLAAAMESGAGEMDGLMQLAVQEGLESRDMREVKIATLEMMVR